jgi:hypothetical protein
MIYFLILYGEWIDSGPFFLLFVSDSTSAQGFGRNMNRFICYLPAIKLLRLKLSITLFILIKSSKKYVFLKILREHNRSLFYKMFYKKYYVRKKIRAKMTYEIHTTPYIVFSFSSVVVLLLFSEERVREVSVQKRFVLQLFCNVKFLMFVFNIVSERLLIKLSFFSLYKRGKFVPTALIVVRTLSTRLAVFVVQLNLLPLFISLFKIHCTKTNAHKFY